MKRVGIVIICVCCVCVLLGMSVPSYTRIKVAVEEVENDVSYVVSDFSTFNLLYDVFLHSAPQRFDSNNTDMLQTVIEKREAGYYIVLEAYPFDDTESLYEIGAYFLGNFDTEAEAEAIAFSVVAPSNLLISAHNDLVEYNNSDNPVSDVLSFFAFFRAIIFFIIGVIMAVAFILVDSFAVIKGLIIAVLKILGIVPLGSF